MSTTFEELPASKPWLGWLVSGLLGTALGVGGTFFYQNVWSRPAPVKRTVLKPAPAAAGTTVEEMLGWWETIESLEVPHSFRVEYRQDGTFFAEPLEASDQTTFLARPLPAEGISGTYNARRVGNSVKVHHTVADDSTDCPTAMFTWFDKTALIRYEESGAELRIRLGRIFGPAPNEPYYSAADGTNR